MEEKISLKILEFMKKRDESIKGDDEEIVLFGIQKIVDDIPKFTLLIILFSILGVFKEFMFVLFIQIIYKTNVGGVHARTNLICTISTTLYFLISIYFCKIFILKNIYMYIIYALMFVFGIYIITKYAPADTTEVPIINRELRRNAKIKSYLFLVLIYILSIFIHIYINNSIELMNYFICPMFLINVFTTKPIYMLYKCKYSYEGGEEDETCN